MGAAPVFEIEAETIPVKKSIGNAVKSFPPLMSTIRMKCWVISDRNLVDQ